MDENVDVIPTVKKKPNIQKRITKRMKMFIRISTENIRRRIAAKERTRVGTTVS